MILVVEIGKIAIRRAICVSEMTILNVVTVNIRVLIPVPGPLKIDTFASAASVQTNIPHRKASFPKGKGFNHIQHYNPGIKPPPQIKHAS